jgi:hypothetical protein
MRHTTRWLNVLCSVALLLVSVAARGFAANPHCSEIGGMIMTNVGGFGTIDGHFTTMGIATGDLKGAIGVEIQEISRDNTTFTVQHHWVTDTGETLAIDQAHAHGTYVVPGLFAVTEYKGHLAGGTGRFADASADLNLIGEIDFNANPGQVVLRYSGTLCHK